MTIGPNILASPGAGNSVPGLPLAIGFNVPVSSVSMQFATDNQPGQGATPLSLAAYANGALVGSAAATGAPGGAFGFPQGTISYNSSAKLGFNGLGVASTGTPYFAVANVSVVPNLNAIVNNAVTVTTNGASIAATFTPNFGLSLQNAAKLAGFANFNWVQTITYLPSPSPFAALSAPGVPLTAPPSFSDPIKGGYTYGGVDNSFPFYYDFNNGELLSHETGGYTLTFGDRPADPCLAGGPSTPLCGGKTVPAQLSKIVFSTELVGVTASNQIDPLFFFNWQSTFNGTAGGVAQTKDYFPLDPGSGLGDVTLLSEGNIADVPELPTWLMMLLGFTGITVVTRGGEAFRRRRLRGLATA